MRTRTTSIRNPVIVLSALFAIIMLVLCGCVVTAGDQDTDGAAVIGVPSTYANPPVSAPQRFTAKSLQLTVKTKSKECFGSAGCVVEFTIKASVAPGVRLAESCDVTYEVHGLSQTQTHTLTVKSDKTYEQDAYQSGDTSGSDKKLTAKVTEVECP